MIANEHTVDRIVELMQRGAKLFVYTNWHIDFGAFTTRIVLEHNGRELTISHREPLPNIRWDHDGFTHKLVSPIDEDKFAERADIKEGYAGYQSDYAREYRAMYEHRDTPTPRWITEQWATPVTMYED